MSLLALITPLTDNRFPNKLAPNKPGEISRYPTFYIFASFWMVSLLINQVLNFPYCPVLCNWVFENFILAEEPFAKVLRSFETWVLVNKNLCGKLMSSLESPTTFDESFKVNSVPFLFQILIYWLANYTILRLRCYSKWFYINIINFILIF